MWVIPIPAPLLPNDPIVQTQQIKNLFTQTFCRFPEFLLPVLS